MASGFIKKIFSFGQKHKTHITDKEKSPKNEKTATDYPVTSRQSAPQHPVIAPTEETAELTPFEAHQAEQRAKAALKAQKKAEQAAKAAQKAAIPREINETGLLVRDEQTGTHEGEKAIEPGKTEQIGWFARLSRGMTQSSRRLNQSLSAAFTKRKLDENVLEELEDVLLQADLGLETSLKITDTLRTQRFGKMVDSEEIRTVMAEEISKVLQPCAKALELDLSYKPHVILVVGVNGTGKTTTIGKLAAKLQAGGLSTMLAAGDTFRAAAIEQLRIWGKRTNSPVIASQLGGDAASLAFEAYQQAQKAGTDVLLIDTAGRLQNKTELMEELAKIVRVLKKHDANAPHTVLQNLDATTGQNALNQVEIFQKTANVNGLVMTKLDGTARGGILVAIAAKYKLPIYFIGVGEDIADLEPFSARDFAAAIAGE